MTQKINPATPRNLYRPFDWSWHPCFGHDLALVNPPLESSHQNSNLSMVTDYIVQGHRYDIYEDYGCWPNIYLSWPAFVLVLPWPTIISSVSLIYAGKKNNPEYPFIFSLLLGFTVRNFLQRRATFNELLKAQSTGLNVNRYFRLMALASIEMLFVFPMSVVALVHNSNLGINPWISWENTHYNFGRISYITTFLFKSSGNNTIVFELTRWCMPLAGFLFFIFFGLASECRKQYRKSFDAFTQTVGIRPAGLQYLDRKDTPYVFFPTTFMNSSDLLLQFDRYHFAQSRLCPSRK